VELDWLETFLAVVDRGGFTAASEQVHRSQSRVSAHIAALERELGIRLIDRSHRPAALTIAGQELARHAREIVAGVGSARSAIAALRAMDAESLTVLTTPCIGTAVFPQVLATLLAEHPGVRLTVSECGGGDVARRFPEEGVVVAVLPALDHPLAPGMQEKLLWREPMRVVVRADHEFALRGSPVRPTELAGQALVVAGGSGDADPEFLQLLAGRGVVTRPRARVDSPQTALAMVRAGVAVGGLNAVALEHHDTRGLVALELDDGADGAGDLVRDVAAYWYDVLVSTPVGKALHGAVLAAPVPAGALAPGPARSGATGPERE
jgi:DNA-binding transcriptional LysR family regulator